MQLECILYIQHLQFQLLNYSTGNNYRCTVCNMWDGVTVVCMFLLCCCFTAGHMEDFGLFT